MNIARCKTCKIKLSCNMGSTTTLIRHINSIHKRNPSKRSL